MIKVLVADTQPLFAECLATALGMQEDLEVLDEQPSLGPQALSATVAAKPDVAIIDYWMPQMGGPAASAAIKSRAPNSRVVLLSWLYGRHELQNALAAGATAFIPKSFRIAALVDTIRKVHSGEAPVYPPELERLLASNKDKAKVEAVWSKLASLTDREMEILRLMGLGYSKAAIAPRLGASPETVRTHISNIRRKLDARTQLEAVALARRYEFIPT